jgi:hypothetical protein
MNFRSQIFVRKLLLSSHSKISSRIIHSKVFRTENKKAHPAGEWAETFSLLSLTGTPPATRMDAT